MRALAILLLAAVPATALAQSSQVTVVGKKNNPREGREDKVTCKRSTVTGSLVQVRKICMAASDWRQQRDDIQRFNSDRVTTCTAPGGCGE